MCIIGELDGMIPCATPNRNVYFEAKTTEKVCIQAGSKFGELEGHLPIIFNALHGLRFSGKLVGLGGASAPLYQACA